MIEKDIKKHLHASSNIRNVVGNRIFAGRAGQTARGALLIVRNITSERFYSLSSEVAAKSSVLQVDCYEDSAVKAYDLSELVRNRLSGYRGTAGDAEIHDTQIVSERAYTEKPENKSDRWVFAYSFDFAILHDSTVPTFN